jgi:hypothetical protein
VLDHRKEVLDFPEIHGADPRFLRYTTIE